MFYHIEHRRLLPPTPQLSTLNKALRECYTPAQSITFEPTRHSAKSAKLVIWSHDWICTAKLDLELIGRLAGKKGNAALARSMGAPPLLKEDLELAGDGLSRSVRKKRAREAREALELVSQSGSSDRLPTPTYTPTSEQSSARDPEFYKIVSDKFRGVVGVDWFGEGEMCVIERPMGDFVGELPSPFWTGSFGKA